MEYVESVCTADIGALRDDAAVLTVFTDERGGILDDLIVTKVAGDHLYVVSNAARKQHDQRHLLNALVRLLFVHKLFIIDTAIGEGKKKYILIPNISKTSCFFSGKI